MIEGKTSAMFEMCARTGAISQVHRTKSSRRCPSGAHARLCFQIMDDVIDLRSDTATLGKTSGSDISSGKRTIIALHA